MISESAILSKLHRESMMQKRDLPTPFIQGIVKGLEIAILLIHETGAEARSVRAEYRGRLNRWSAAKFRHAIIAAMNYLNRGDRSRGIRILQAAIEHEGEPKKCARSL